MWTTTSTLHLLIPTATATMDRRARLSWRTPGRWMSISATRPQVPCSSQFTGGCCVQPCVVSPACLRATTADDVRRPFVAMTECRAHSRSCLCVARRRHLRKVPKKIKALLFLKWPARIPSAGEELCVRLFVARKNRWIRQRLQRNGKATRASVTSVVTENTIPPCTTLRF